MQVTRQTGGSVRCRNKRSAGPRECIENERPNQNFPNVRPVRQRGKCPPGQVKIDNRCVRRRQPGIE